MRTPVDAPLVEAAEYPQSLRREMLAQKYVVTNLSLSDNILITRLRELEALCSPPLCRKSY